MSIVTSVLASIISAGLLIQAGAFMWLAFSLYL